MRFLPTGSAFLFLAKSTGTCLRGDTFLDVFDTGSTSMRLIATALVILCSCTESKKTKQIWKKSEITWIFSDPFHLVKSDTTVQLMRSLLNTSFTLWQNGLNGRLRITEVRAEPADIEIYFARGHHGDKEAFDGPGRLVAHSGLPSRGYLHLDADEKWSFDGERDNLDLRYVILHETGHLLGLRHLWKQKAIMNPYYRKFKNGMSLLKVDVEAIQKLYTKQIDNLYKT